MNERTPRAEPVSARPAQVSRPTTLDATDRPRRPSRSRSAPASSNGPAAQATDTYEELRAELLAEIQHRGVVAAEAAAVEPLAAEVVRAYQARAQSGLGGRPLGSPGEMVDRLCRSVLAYGPLTPFVNGEETYEEVIVVGGDIAYVDGNGRWGMVDEACTEAEMRSAVDRLLATVGAAVDESQPIAQVQILDGQGRLGVVIPPVAGELNASLRRYLLRHENLEREIAWDTLTPEAANLLAATTHTPTGLVITGQPSSGKTSLANAILRAAPEALRVICCEDTPEINPEHLTPFRWRTRRAGPDGSGEVTLRDLVRHALGMRPDLIVVGEVRGAEAYELTRAGNAGCGMLTTLHANSARAGLQALMSTAVMAGQNVDAAQVRAVFCSIVDLVVHLEREPLATMRSGQGRVRRQVTEIAAVPLLQANDSDFTVEPVFVREELGAPLSWTGAPLPDELHSRLDRALRPRGVTVQGILEGREWVL